jgi:hypothetical protein
MRFYGVIKDRTLTYRDKARLVQFLRGLKDQQKVTIDITREKKLRTLPQNNRYWGFIVPEVVNDTGEDKELVHEFFKSKFLKLKYKKVFGKKVGYRTTTTLTTDEFNEFTERVMAFTAQEWGYEWNI